MLVDDGLRLFLPFASRSPNSTDERRVEIGFKRLLDDLAQRVGAQRRQSVNLGLFVAEGVLPLVGAQFAWLQRR